MLTAIVLAAGNSRRFLNRLGGPKQFLKFKLEKDAVEKQMWENVFACLGASARRVLVVQYTHMEYLNGTPPDYDLVGINPTSGQSSTLYSALRQLRETDNERPLDEIMVLNCDAGYAPGCLDRLLLTGRHFKRPAAITFKAPKSEENRWSFVDGHPYFYNCAEKFYISENALAGAYYFPNQEKLYQAVRSSTAFDSEMGREPYLSHAFRFLDREKTSVNIDRSSWYDWGTPEALEKFLRGPDEYTPHS